MNQLINTRITGILSIFMNKLHEREKSIHELNPCNAYFGIDQEQPCFPAISPYQNSSPINYCLPGVDISGVLAAFSIFRLVRVTFNSKPINNARLFA